MSLSNIAFAKSNTSESYWRTVGVFDTTKWDDPTWNFVKEVLSVKESKLAPTTAQCKSLMIRAAVNTNDEVKFVGTMLATPAEHQDYNACKTVSETLLMTSADILKYVEVNKTNKTNKIKALKV